LAQGVERARRHVAQVAERRRADDEFRWLLHDFHLIAIKTMNSFE